LLLLVGIFCPLLAPYDPLAISDSYGVGPSIQHPFGTDQLGRDVFSRVLYGTRLSLQVAGGAVGIALLVGGLVGLVAGYFGGWVDEVISRLLDIMFAVPEVLLALVVMAVIGEGLGKIALAIAVVYTPIFARVCRGSVLSAKREVYVDAARAAGCSNVRIMFRHVLPAAAAPLIVQTTLSLAFAILAESALSFLGLSGETDTPSWGMMLRKGKDLMTNGKWWIAVFPGLAITLVVMSFNVLGDRLRDILDPRNTST